MSINESIKKLIKKRFYGAYTAHRLRKNTEFKQWVEDFDNCSSVLRFQELGNLNPNRNIYIMRFDSRGWGLFAYWKFGLLGLEFADRYNLTPVIDWTSNSPFYEREGIDGFYNPFEYFYLPVSDVSVEDAYKSRNVTMYSRQSRGFVDVTYADQENLDLVSICKKYYRLRPEIESKIYQEINDLIGKKKTIAVHIRGVDWGNIKRHPIPIGLDDYALKIHEALDQGFEQVFLATDAEQTVKYMSDKFGDKIVVYQDVERTAVGSHTLVIFNEHAEDDGKFRLGYEVLRDMYTLSCCDGLICGYSNISLAATVTKEVRGERYEYSWMFRPKMNTTGMSSNKAEELMRKGKFK